LNILINTTSYPKFKGDFSGVFIHRLAKSIVNMGHEVKVVVPHSENLPYEEIIEDVDIYRYKYLPSIFEAKYGNWYAHEQSKGNIERIYIQSKNLIRMLALSYRGYILNNRLSSSSDIIFSNWVIPNGLIGHFSSKKMKLPHLIKVYGGDITIAGRIPILKKIVKKTLESSNRILSNSYYTATKVKDICDSPVTPVYEGVNTEFFNPNIDPSNIREKYSGDPIIFSLGRLVQYKGFEYAIKSVPIIKKRFPNLKWIIGGTGPLSNSLNKLIKNLKLENSIHLIGFIPEKDLPSFYSACDLYVAPSIIDEKGNTEGLNVSVLEAASTGKPVIATKVGGLIEAVKDGETGLLVQEKNSLKLANTITTLISNKKLAISLGNKGRKRIMKYFDINIIAENMINIFEETIRNIN